MALDSSRLAARLYRGAGCCPAYTHCRALSEDHERFVHADPVTTCVHVTNVHPALHSVTGLCDQHAALARARDADTHVIARMHSV